MIDYRNIIKNREFRLKLIKQLSWIPDRIYLKMVYFIKTGRILNLDNPKGFNEKLQWLKIHHKNPAYTRLVDKIAVRKVIEKQLGPNMMFKVLGVWNSFEEIDFNSLPDRFVLKCTHDSGSVKIIQNKKELTMEKLNELNEFFTGRLKINSFCLSREYPYKRVKPRIMAEEYMETDDDKEGGIKDYKFYCFHGEPKLLLVISGRKKKNQGGYHEDFFDMNYKRLNIQNGYTESDIAPSIPINFEKMKEYAKKLSSGIPHVRIDFYEVDNKIYFGEYTFFSSGGFLLFEPDEWERRMGDWIKID